MQHPASCRLREERATAPPKRTMDITRKVMLFLMNDVEQKRGIT